MKKLLLLFLIITSTPPLQAQSWDINGARSNSLGNASVTIIDNWSYFNNPANTSLIQKKEFGVCYENRFLLKEFQKQGFSFMLPIKKGVFSIGTCLQGNENLKTYKSGLGYSLKLFDNLHLGTQLNYVGIRLPNYYGTKNTITAEIGLLTNISPKWNFGFAIFNLTNNQLSEFNNERIPSKLRLGTSYQFSKEVITFLEFQKTNYTPLQFKSGIEYSLKSIFHIRLGVSTTPLEINFGFGTKWKNLSIDIASNYHSILGFSPSISLNYNFKK